MLKKFDKECNRILNTYKIIAESNGFSDSDELLEEIFDIKGFSSFKEFKKDSELIEKIKMTDKNIIEDAAKGLWENSIEKFNEDDESEKQSLEFSKQIYCFLNECF
jgi:hypothetical protein